LDTDGNSLFSLQCLTTWMWCEFSYHPKRTLILHCFFLKKLAILNWIVCCLLIFRYIGMKPSSDGKHLSLFLYMKDPNDLPKDSGKLTEVSLSIKDLENGKDQKLSGSHFSRKFAWWA
jgi:hypothetical protein